MNLDTSVALNSAAGSGIVRDRNGDVIFAFYKKFGENEVLEAEAMALMHGLTLYKTKKIVNLEVEEDSTVLVHLLQRKAIGK